MSRPARPHSTANRSRRVALLVAPTVGVLAATAAPAVAQPGGDDAIVLPGARSAEGIADGRGDTF